MFGNDRDGKRKNRGQSRKKHGPKKQGSDDHKIAGVLTRHFFPRPFRACHLERGHKNEKQTTQEGKEKSTDTQERRKHTLRWPVPAAVTGHRG